MLAWVIYFWSHTKVCFCESCWFVVSGAVWLWFVARFFLHNVGIDFESFDVSQKQEKIVLLEPGFTRLTVFVEENLRLVV